MDTSVPAQLITQGADSSNDALEVVDKMADRW